MDFTLSPEIEDLRLRVRAFVEKEVLPLEADPVNFSAHENIPEERLKPVREKARKAGLWAPQSPKEYGGMELPIVAWAAIYEEAARSLFGPLAINCMAPDDGNMNLLRLVGTREQKEKWLKPIVDGKVRSSFAMTEPHPGSGSDPAMMLHARREKGRQIRHQGPQMVHHRRRRRGPLHPHRAHLRRQAARPHRLSLPQGPARLAHRAPHRDPRAGGARRPLRTRIRRPRSADENVLMGVGDGLKATQIRLGPARLTHCMRWTGWAKRCLEIAQAYVNEREGFGVKLGDRESVQIKLGEVGAADPDQPAAHHARRLDARPGRPRAQGSVDGQGAGRRHAAQGRRRRDPAAGRARLLQGHAGRMDLPRGARGPPGRRRERSAHDGAGALHARGRPRLLAVGPGRGAAQCAPKARPSAPDALRRRCRQDRRRKSASSRSSPSRRSRHI